MRSASGCRCTHSQRTSLPSLPRLSSHRLCQYIPSVPFARPHTSSCVRPASTLQPSVLSAPHDYACIQPVYVPTVTTKLIYSRNGEPRLTPVALRSRVSSAHHAAPRLGAHLAHDDPCLHPCRTSCLAPFPPPRAAWQALIPAQVVILSLVVLTSKSYFGPLSSYGTLSIPDSYYDWALGADGSDTVDRTRVSEVDAPAPGPLLTRRANATFVMLARNSDLDGALRSVRDAEDRFNHRYGYPWVFLNEEPFSDDFKRRITNIISGTVEFGLIPREHWYQPEWIDDERAVETRRKMKEDNIIYGGTSPARVQRRAMLILRR
jgi:hypothetical protein